MTVIWRLVLALVGAWLVWRIVAVGVADRLADPKATDAARDSDTSLVWSPENEAAILDWARQHVGDVKGDVDAALAGVVVRNPANPRPLLLLAATANGPARADALVDAATRLAPNSPAGLIQAGTYWLGRGEPERAMQSYSQAMIADRTQVDRLSPLLLKLLEEPETRGLFQPFARTPPEWWDRFFGYVSKTAADVETVRALYYMRKTAVSPSTEAAPAVSSVSRSPVAIGESAANPDAGSPESTAAGAMAEQLQAPALPLTPAEREAYVERLRRERQYTEAYLTWVNGLDEAQRQWLGLLNNGSFEVEPTGRGYDWRVHPGPHVVIETAETYGTDGKRALHLAFRGFDARFGNVSQDLFLDPGQYRLVGRARPDGLKSSGGIKWQVQCDLAGGSTLLAETTPFLGTDQWNEFVLDFAVPDGCERPVLRLIGAIRTAGDQRLEGSIWFDGFRIQRATPAPGGA